MNRFSAQQRVRILSNPNVQSLSESTISFKPAFKIKAVKQYLAGKSPIQIFMEADLPVEYFKDDYCRCCIKKWVKKYEAEGEESLKLDLRGSGNSGRPKGERLEELTYDELLALVEIQKEVIEDLKKKKALAKKKF